MNRFDFNTLAKCGAKTRSGEPCKRFGNKSNGRCKLHGGKSTGAKSKDGKLVVSKNAVINSFKWQLNLDIAKETPERVDYVVKQLRYITKHISESALIDEQLTLLFSEYRIDVESLKYGVLNKFGLKTFILVQSALDRYYKVVGSDHMKFYLLSPVIASPHFDKGDTAIKEHYHHEWLYKSCYKPL